MINIVETKIKNCDGINKYNSKAIRTNNTFKYQENDFKVVLKIEQNKIHLNRSNKSISQKFVFTTDDISSLEYTLKDNDYKFKLDFKTKKINVLNNKIIILYEIEGNEIEYSLKYKEVL